MKETHMRRSFVLCLAFVSFVALGSLPPTADAQTTGKSDKRSSGKRNVVLVIADDMGLDLACYGNNKIRVPNLNAFAKKGVVFSRAYATVSSCSPSRASIYTGLYSHQNGQYGLQHRPHSQHTHDFVQSLPNLLRA